MSDSKLIQILVISTGIFLSSISGWLLEQAEKKAIINEFRKDVNERAASIYRQVTINFEALRSLGILFNGDTVPEIEQFSLEAQKILYRYNDIQALEWVPHIIHSKRAEYESRQRQEFSGFEITEQKEKGLMVTAGERQEYFPVTYIEPLIANQAALGFDLASNPTRLEALKKSRDTGTPQITACMTLIQEKENQKGFLAFLPIYEGTPSSVRQRRKNLRGFVLGVYRIGDIFASSVLNNEFLGIEMILVDETIPSSHKILHTYQLSGFTAHESITYRKELPDIWGRKWTLIASPTLSYIAVRRSLLPLATFFAGTIFTFLIALYIHMICQVNKKLELLSRTDALTGVANRRYFNEVLEREWLRAIRLKSFMSLIFIDVDFFKLYNDNYGHLEGDKCLKKIAEKLKSLVHRPIDLIARYGGEEFALLLPDTEEAESLANKCQQSIMALQIPHESSKAADVVTISVGLCTVAPQKGTESSWIIDLADKALYKAKEAGRNRVEQADIRDKLLY